MLLGLEPCLEEIKCSMHIDLWAAAIFDISECLGNKSLTSKPFIIIEVIINHCQALSFEISVKWGKLVPKHPIQKKSAAYLYIAKQD